MLPRPALALALLVLATPAWAQAGRIRSIQADTTLTRISGTWPTSCTPTVADWSRDGAGGIDIVLGEAGTGCTPLAHDFHLELRHGEAFSPRPPEHRVQPVRVFVPGRNETPLLAGFALRGGHGATALPDSGFWWPQGDAATSGNVLSLELQGDTLGIALLDHDDLSGAPVWYFGTSRVEGRTSHANLSRLDDGASPFFGLATQPVPHAGPDIFIAFDSATRARVWLSRQDPVRQGAIELVELEFARRSFSNQAQPQRWLGHWLVARDADPAATAGGWPATLDFTTSDPAITGRWSLLDRDGFALECDSGMEIAANAQHCVLRTAAGEVLARFGRVGLDRLDGTDRNGHTVVLLRSP